MVKILSKQFLKKLRKYFVLKDYYDLIMGLYLLYPYNRY